MYLRECLIQNVGPIVEIDISFDFTSTGSPKPIILVGKNGTGKTIVLAYIIDALAELAKVQFRDIVNDQRIGHMPFIKVSSGGDSRSLSGPHYCFLEFAKNEKKCCYVEKVGALDPKSLTQKMRGRFQSIAFWKKDDAFHKKANGEKKQIEEFFQKCSVCFFPASRHERPHWRSTIAIDDQQVYGDYTRMQGELRKPLVVERAAEDNRQWLMDVFLDSMVEFDLIPQSAADGRNDDMIVRPRAINIAEKAALRISRSNVEQLLRHILEDEHARFVLNYRNAIHGRLGIRLGNDVIVPSVEHMSAGQSILFNMFATLIRYADRNDINNSIRLDQIEGIILIDEIEAHLHSDLQYEVLPRLLKLFPRVQFIVSSHAPLFLLGLEREYGTNGVQIIEMPIGREIGTERFEEFRRSFELYQQTKQFEDVIEKQFQHATRPIVLTEGQTDPVYIRTALELLGHNSILEALEIDQVGSSGRGGASGGGDSHLNKARTFLSHNYHRFNRRVLLLYDSDTGKPSEENGQLIQRTIPKNPDNKRVTSGIENLLPEVLFEERFYSKQEKPRPDGGSAVITTLNKEEFCRWVCEVRKETEDFSAFETYLVPILREFVGSDVDTSLKP